MIPLTIGDRTIGPSQPALVIAEIGVNHDGSVERALELVRLAVEAGADAVKLQVFRADVLMHPSSSFADYQRSRVADDDPIQMLRRYELPNEGIAEIASLARELGILLVATPFSPSDVDVIERLELAAVKIASPDLINIPLLRRAAQLDKPLILSTGAATMAEIRKTFGWLGQMQADFALLHCVSSYPVCADDANLCWISELANEFAVPVGYSDHTTEVLGGALAVAAGACIVEKHLTYDSAASGPDHSASADPAMFAAYVRLIRQAEALRGQSGRRVLAVEQDVRTVSRQSLVLRRELAAGETIVPSVLTVQRPGTGISAAHADAVVGRITRQALPAGTLLTWDMLAAAIEIDAA